MSIKSLLARIRYHNLVGVHFKTYFHYDNHPTIIRDYNVVAPSKLYKDKWTVRTDDGNWFYNHSGAHIRECLTSKVVIQMGDYP